MKNCPQQPPSTFSLGGLASETVKIVTLPHTSVTVSQITE